MNLYNPNITLIRISLFRKNNEQTLTQSTKKIRKWFINEYCSFNSHVVKKRNSFQETMGKRRLCEKKKETSREKRGIKLEEETEEYLKRKKVKEKRKRRM